MREEKEKRGRRRRSLICSSKVCAELLLAADTVQVVHGAVEGELHSFSDRGTASLL